MQQDFKQIGISITQKRSTRPRSGRRSTEATTTTTAGFSHGRHRRHPRPGFAVATLLRNLGGWTSAAGATRIPAGIRPADQTIDLAQRHQLVTSCSDAYNARPAIVLFYAETIDVHSKDWTVFGPIPMSFNSLSKVTFTRRTMSERDVHPERPQPRCEHGTLQIAGRPCNAQ